jgi:DNA-binding response OmpR family regulator
MMAAKASVLVIDDEEIITRVIGATLENAGYAVFKAGDGPSGLIEFEKQKPDLVLLDIRMPGLDGFEVLKRIRETSGVPVVMITTVTDVKALAECLALGADDYIEKPFLTWELIAHVKAKIRRSQWGGQIAA